VRIDVGHAPDFVEYMIDIPVFSGGFRSALALVNGALYKLQWVANVAAYFDLNQSLTQRRPDVPKVSRFGNFSFTADQES
jgi:hypothetical protein